MRHLALEALLRATGLGAAPLLVAVLRLTAFCAVPLIGVLWNNPKETERGHRPTSGREPWLHRYDGIIWVLFRAWSSFHVQSEVTELSRTKGLRPKLAKN